MSVHITNPPDMKSANIFVALLLSFLLVSGGFAEGEGTVADVKTKEQLAAAYDPQDQVSVLYLFDRETRDKESHSRFAELAKKLAGFAQFFAGKCNELDDKSFAPCADDSREQRPLVLINRPPEFKVNPYTNKPMETQRIRLTRIDSFAHPQ